MGTVLTIADAPNHDVIGRTFRAHDGKTYICDSHESNAGFWMTEVDPLKSDDQLRRTNVSERAIGRTFHDTNPFIGRSVHAFV